MADDLAHSPADSTGPSSTTSLHPSSPSPPPLDLKKRKGKNFSFQRTNNSVALGSASRKTQWPDEPRSVVCVRGGSWDPGDPIERVGDKDVGVMRVSKVVKFTGTAGACFGAHSRLTTH